MSSWIINIALFFIVLFISIFSFKRKVLSLSGSIAGLAIGLIILFFGGWTYLTVILIFFIASAIATKVKSDIKRRKSVVEWKSIRSWNNVLTNGALPTFFVLLERLINQDVLIMGFLGSLGTAMADTMATEIGLLYPGQPRLSTNLRKRVPAGTSGAISVLGLVATVVGAFIIGAVAWVLGIGSNLPLLKVTLITTVAGTVGSIVDSFVGAALQGVYKCKYCGRIVEEMRHCEEVPKKLKGFKLVNNDIVNLIAISFGSMTAIVLFLLYL